MCRRRKVGLGFSSNIFNVSSTFGDVPLYFEDINMNSRKIKNLGGPPIDDGDVANKKYVDEQMQSKILQLMIKLANHMLTQKCKSKY